MEYPPLRAYMASMMDAANLQIPFFQSQTMKIFLNRRGAPFMSVGGFGAVFRFKDAHDRQFALKVFTRDVPGRAERYRLLHDTLAITKFPFLVDFQYVEDGIKVGKSHYPAVVMEWGRGLGLDRAISSDLADDGIMQSAPEFAGNIFSVVRTLQQWNMAHGDLQEGNILVQDDNRITLIDYDGMFVPALEGKNATEIGLADYQHPARTQSNFGPTLDDFALLTILFQLAIIEPEVWDQHHDDRRLVLKKADHENPQQSEIIKKHLKSRTAHIKALANLLAEACAIKDPLRINAVAKIAGDSDIMGWLRITEETDADSQYTSIISKVVALSEDEVQEYESQEDVLVEDEEYEEEVDAAEPAAAAHQRPEPEGSWGAASTVAENFQKGIIDFFFEEVESSRSGTNQDGPAKTPAEGEDNAFDKIKSGVMSFLFEPTAGNKGGAQQPQDPPPAKPAQPVKAAPKPKHTTKSSGGTAKKSTTKRTKKTAPKKSAPRPDAKSAPLPDWMKQRRPKD